ncbi:MAG: right-handed parallel beta-helix repeat-containing protein [Paludibacteraceae bacterium]|nr:right-handed parallel beta-helix repeat-containing protein [Paludibacteraceae bacterium]
MNRHGFILAILVILLAACNRNNPILIEKGIVFSQDTVSFDTVFTSKGSTTRIFKIYNTNRSDITIRHFRLGEGKYFHINIDGESDLSKLDDYLLAGGDSLFVFVSAFIDPQDANSPVLIADNLNVETDDASVAVRFEAYGQDVEILRELHIKSDTLLKGEKPYFVMRYVEVDSACTLTINKGTIFYMADSAQLVVRGSLRAEGTLEEPITFRGSRMYDIYDRVPYDYVSGLWGGIFLLTSEGSKNECSYLDIHSATVGLYCSAANSTPLPEIELLNCRIHNNAVYGLVLHNFNSKIVNCELTNCSSYCVYIAGGNHTFVHNTIASYFNSSNVSLHSIGKENVSAMFVNNLSKNNAKTHVTLSNSIVAGSSAHNFTLATPLPDYYQGLFHNNCLKTDSIANTQFTDNIFIKSGDKLFANTYYNRNNGEYYNFSLDSLSLARDTADINISLLYPTDRLGRSRLADGKPDIGCYEYSE